MELLSFHLIALVAVDGFLAEMAEVSEALMLQSQQITVPKTKFCSKIVSNTWWAK